MSFAAQDEAVFTEQVNSLKNRKNFASSSSGANVLTASSGIFNRQALLSANSETYLTVSECNSERTETLVINLSDDVLIDTILVFNREDFSSPLGLISFYGSIDYPPQDDAWRFLGKLQPELSFLEGHDGRHLLMVGQQASSESEESIGQSMVRYLKVEMTGHERN